jgi:hypothetical protein
MWFKISFSEVEFSSDTENKPETISFFKGVEIK